MIVMVIIFLGGCLRDTHSKPSSPGIDVNLSHLQVYQKNCKTKKYNQLFDKLAADYDAYKQNCKTILHKLHINT